MVREHDRKVEANLGPAVGVPTLKAPTEKILTERGFTYPATATNVPTKLLESDLNRTFFSFINNDALGRVTVSFGLPQPFGVGMPANPGGGGFILDNHCPTTAIYITGDVASNANLSYTVK